MIDKIHTKLQLELSKEILSEVQVVYILALTRKILEAEDLKESFPILNFFCNWALHYRIDDIRKVEEELNGLIGGDAGKVLILSQTFFTQLLQFFEQKSFTHNIKSTKFIFDVMNVCAYSPLVVDSPDREKKVKITLLENTQIPGSVGSYSWGVQVEDLNEPTSPIRQRRSKGRRRSRRFG